jgi:hypothetical protein
MSIRLMRIRFALLTAIVVPLGALFWRLESSRARLQTMMDSERASDERR